MAHAITHQHFGELDADGFGVEDRDAGFGFDFFAAYRARKDSSAEGNHHFGAFRFELLGELDHFFLIGSRTLARSPVSYMLSALMPLMSGVRPYSRRMLRV